MAEKNNSNKIITIVLAAVITISAIVIIYVNLPKETEKEDNTLPEIPIEENYTIPPNATLKVIYGDQQLNYSFVQLEEMTAYTEIGGKINKKIVTTGPYNYTGVKISTILNQIENLPETYNITATSSDGYTQEYSYDEVQGKVTLYNETRVETGISNLTMIIAYVQGGYLDSTEGPLMIAFVDNYYTDSGLWAKKLVSIEIVGV